MCCCTNLQDTSAEKTQPICKNPVGLGAKREQVAFVLGGYFFSKSAIVWSTSGNIKSAKSFQSAIFPIY